MRASYCGLREHPNRVVKTLITVYRAIYNGSGTYWYSTRICADCESQAYKLVRACKPSGKGGFWARRWSNVHGHYGACDNCDKRMSEFHRIELGKLAWDICVTCLFEDPKDKEGGGSES
jgi:hypothetical protein